MIFAGRAGGKLAPLEEQTWNPASSRLGERRQQVLCDRNPFAYVKVCHSERSEAESRNLSGVGDPATSLGMTEWGIISDARLPAIFSSPEWPTVIVLR